MEAEYLELQENLEDTKDHGGYHNKCSSSRKQQMLYLPACLMEAIRVLNTSATSTIAYENKVDVLDISAFNGNAKSYVVHPDGRVVIDHSFEAWGTVYNFFGVLREHSNISEKEILELSEKFKERRTDTMLVNLDGSKLSGL